MTFVFVHAERARLRCASSAVSICGGAALRVDQPPRGAACGRDEASSRCGRAQGRACVILVGRKRPERLMRERGLQTARKRRLCRSRTDSTHTNSIAPKVLDWTFLSEVCKRV